MIQKLKAFVIKTIYSLFRLLPVRKNEVLLFSYYGEQYSGSPKYIGQYLADKSDLRVTWAFVTPKKYQGLPFRTVRYGHLSYYYRLAVSGTVITNYRMTEDFVKRKGQKYVQTWHSSLRLKMIEKDAEDTLPETYVRMAKRDSTQIDCLLAGSRKSREIFERAFWYDGQIVNTGTPQCDILLGDCTGTRRKVLDHFGFPEGAKIALYAPTFRKNHDTSVYDLDPEALLAGLREKFGGDWYLLMRLHPHLVKLTDCFRYSEHVLQATDYDDAQELLAAADVLISDYSAIMFDFSVTRRLCLLYVPDLETYTAADRNLYFDIGQLPFPHFGTQADMMSYIGTVDYGEYRKNVSRFIEGIGSYDDGNACQRVYELIRG